MLYDCVMLNCIEQTLFLIDLLCTGVFHTVLSSMFLWFLVFGFGLRTQSDLCIDVYASMWILLYTCDTHIQYWSTISVISTRERQNQIFLPSSPRSATCNKLRCITTRVSNKSDERQRSLHNLQRSVAQAAIDPASLLSLVTILNYGEEQGQEKAS
jgi:hypothetical protein